MASIQSSSVQGTALIFNPQHDWVNGGVLLKPQKITMRNLTPKDCIRYFIENTNIDNLPKNGLGSLVAFSKADTQTREKRMWSLGVLIYLHPTQTIIAPCNTINFGCKNLTVDRYRFSKTAIVFDSTEAPHLCLIYLNALSGNNTCGGDGYIECDVEGPDVLFQENEIPTETIYLQYKKALKNTDPLYQVIKPSQPSASKSSSPLSLNTDLTKRLIVIQNKSFREPGFAFPYPCGLENPYPNLVKFAFLNYSQSLRLISQKSITIDMYISELNRVSLYSEYISVEHIDGTSLSIEEVSG